ncbi:hypothetical protein VPHD505_0045 [Vibrio phage D505]
MPVYKDEPDTESSVPVNTPKPFTPPSEGYQEKEGRPTRYNPYQEHVE